MRFSSDLGIALGRPFPIPDFWLGTLAFASSVSFLDCFALAVSESGGTEDCLFLAPSPEDFPGLLASLEMEGKLPLGQDYRATVGLRLLQPELSSPLRLDRYPISSRWCNSRTLVIITGPIVWHIVTR